MPGKNEQQNPLSESKGKNVRTVLVQRVSMTHLGRATRRCHHSSVRQVVVELAIELAAAELLLKILGGGQSPCLPTVGRDNNCQLAGWRTVELVLGRLLLEASQR